MRVIATVPQGDLRAYARAAKAMEETGYDVLMSMENKHEPFMPLAVAAVNTSRIGLATGVAIAFPRSPMVIASTCWDLQVASNGRMVLGIGTQVKGHNERRFSVPWSAPGPRLRDYVLALKAIWRAWEKGTPLDYRGEHYQFTLMTPYFVPPSKGLPPVPVTIAAVGPYMQRLSGEVCDGVRLHPFHTERYQREVSLTHIEAGLKASGRKRETFEVTSGLFICTGPTEADVDRMFQWARSRVAFYGSTRTYWPVFKLHGLVDLGEKLHRLSLAGKWDEMTRSVPDSVVELFTLRGTHKAIAGEIKRGIGDHADAIYANLMPDTAPDYPPDLIQDIQRIPTPFKGYSKAW
ncbi:MAG: TIGR03617 family F420-dependent LLM class oxidoreductase [Alphaproteobacteria bacterium]